MNMRLIGLCASMVALAGAALATGKAVYYALLALLMLMLLYALASAVWTILTLDVTMKGVRPRAVRGDRLMTILTARHTCPLPVSDVRLLLNVPGGNGGYQEISLRARPFARSTFRNVVRCPHRGNYDVGVVSVSALDLFGLVRITRKSGKRLMRVEVAPRAMQTDCLRLRASDTGAEFASRATEDNASPSDIRKWQDGDELKKIHWKLSLRKRELIVRTFENSARPDTLILPDLTQITALRDQRLALEDGICEACLGAAQAQLNSQYPVRMPLVCTQPQELSGKNAADLAAFRDALTRVAFNSPYSYEQVLLQMTQRLQRTGGVVLATSDLSTRIADIALRMLRLGVMVKLFFITDAPRGETLEMLEMLKLAGAIVMQIDPWQLENTDEKQS